MANHKVTSPNCLVDISGSAMLGMAMGEMLSGVSEVSLLLKLGSIA